MRKRDFAAQRRKVMHDAKHTRRKFLTITGAGAAAIGFPSFLTAGQASKGKPNIILIMADDMGFSDIGCYGGEIRTPNLDRLASGGIRFSQFYNAARCCPTRASLLTGLYPHQAGMGDMVTGVSGLAETWNERETGFNPYQGYLNRRCVTIAEVLKEAGYTTLMSGKWHVGEDKPNWPTDRGFDRYFGLISGAANYFDLTKGKQPGVVRKMAIDGRRYYTPSKGFYMTDAISDHAVGYMNQYGGQETPFFMYVAYTAPHWPLHALPEDIAKYKGKFLDGWDELRLRRYRRQVQMGLIKDSWPLTPRDVDAEAWDTLSDKTKEEMDLKMAVYAAQIESMDRGIGRILETVRKNGDEENTLVLFLSDNGGCHEAGKWGFDLRNNGLPPGGVDSFMSYGFSWANLSNTPFRLYKHWVHEGGISTPLIVRWPGVITGEGSITHEIGHIIDLMATCCDVSGTAYPESYDGNRVTPLEGKSLLSVIKGENRTGHDVLYWEHEGNRAVRKGKWKLVSKDRGTWELYDLEADRTEMRDLTGTHPGITEEMKGLFMNWAERCGVRL